MSRVHPWLLLAWSCLLAGPFSTAVIAADADGGKPAPYGIQERVPLVTSRVLGYPEPPLPYRAYEAFPKLKFKAPVYLNHEPGSRRLLVVEQKGRILAFENDPAGEATQVFLQLEDRDAYSIIFHPKFQENRYAFVFSNGPNKDAKKKNRISRYTVTAESPRRCDPETEFVIIEWESNGHNGGDMAFAPDGMLFISSGDGTSDSDGDLTGQDIRDLTSGMLRIDVDHPDPGKGYAVPPDNPFLQIPDARPELWAYGFRNPWRIFYDLPNDRLWVGDIGQDLWEMIQIIKRGANYGWSVHEGSHPFYLERKRGPTPISPPTIEHPHSEARSITGGLVYRGSKFPDLVGAYVYGDYGTGKVWAARCEGDKVTWHREIADTPWQILGFGADQAGEMYFVDYGGGMVYGFEAVPPVENLPIFPEKLSETGLFQSVAGHVTEPALIPYSVNAPLWSDNAHKERFIALPELTRIDFTETGAWKFPERTVLVKTFSLDMQEGRPETRRRIETRLLLYQQSEWTGYSYLWNEEQTDATLVPAAGMDATYAIRPADAAGDARQQTWHYPSRAECMVCHSRAANYVLGLTTAQMNKVHDYGGVLDNQLRTLDHLSVFKSDARSQWAAVEKSAAALRTEATQTWTKVLSARAKLRPAGGTALPLPEPLPAVLSALRRVARTAGGVLVAHGLRPAATSASQWWKSSLDWTRKRLKSGAFDRLGLQPDSYAKLADPYDETADLEKRVRAYLQSNCAQCHVAAGGGNAAMELGIGTPLDKTKLIGERPQHDAFGIPDALLVAPGQPERSILLQRVARVGRGRMPPLATSIPDPGGAKLLREWIAQMKDTAKDTPPAATPAKPGQ